MEDLGLLASLIRQRNAAEIEIAAIIRRPANIGNLGEYIASKIFNIELVHSGSHKAIDGHFSDGPLAGRSVNIKWYGRQEGLLDMTPESLPDYYLALTGPKLTAALERTTVRPWLIEYVFLFDAAQLAAQLLLSGKPIGMPAGVRREHWTHAETYPQSNNSLLTLTVEQREALALFR